MRTAEIDYKIPGEDSAEIMITVNYSLDFEVEGRGTEDATVNLSAHPMEIQVMIGRMPFACVKWEDIPQDYPFRDWIRARTTEVTFEACGYTRDEAFREACEEEDDREEESRQIGWPL